MNIGVKFRIYPTKEQEIILSEYCRVAHDMQNFLVAKYQDKFPAVNSYGIKDYTPQDLIAEFGINVPQRIVLGVIKTYSTAVARVYKRIGNKPKFHKYDPNKQSFYVASQTIKVINGCIKMPSLRGIKLGISKKISVDMKYVKKFGVFYIKEPRFTHINNVWMLSGSHDINEPEQQNKAEFLGLDWGIRKFYTTSNGEFINYPKSVLRQFQRINRLKSYRDKKIKYSNNWYKTNNKIKKAYQRLENLKRDFIDKKTTGLCKNNNISIENLANAKMNRSKKFIRRQNTISPRNRFVEKLKWKCVKFGTKFVEVNPSYTSKTCSKCGNVNINLKMEEIFKCHVCGFVLDRDVNAAINIAARAVCCSH